jgi:hypothetical protein
MKKDEKKAAEPYRFSALEPDREIWGIARG